MAKEKDAPPPSYDTAAKMQAFSQAVAALEPLSRLDRLDVLRAVANFYGLVISIEAPR
jgi:hypothetical protein